MFLKKWAAGILATALLAANIAFAETPVVKVLPFSDVPLTYDYFTAVKYLNSEGVVVGYGDGSFKPDQEINRAEFLKIAMEVGGMESAGSGCYKDVKDQWFAPYVCAATKAGVVKGYEDGTFKPAAQINFAEASKIIVNIAELEKEDAGEEVWYFPFVKSLEKRAAIPPSILAFDKKITRGEMAEIMWRIWTENVSQLSGTFETVKNGRAPKAEVAADDSALRSFTSCAEVESYLEKNIDNEEIYYTMEEAEVDDSAANSGDGLKAAPGGGSEDFSATNVQVKGVDEADIVKTDGEFIYFLKGNTVRIVKAYPASALEEVAQIKLEDGGKWMSAVEMYVDSGRLVVIAQSGAPVYIMEDAVKSIMPVPNYSDNTQLYIFDISNKEKPELMREVSFEGSYLSSRKVDDQVYVVTNKYTYYWAYQNRENFDQVMPLFSDSAKNESGLVAPCDEVIYRPDGFSSDFIVVAGVPVDEKDAEIKREVIVGSSTEIYSSRENMYIVEPRYEWNYNYENTKEETVVHKFALNEGAVSYTDHGVVPGTILNQFSMDEDGDFFRIATTKGNAWDTKNPSTNNMYVLDSAMEVVGKIEGIAPGESIYSVRFMGDRAYMVTFKKVDPFFVIDMKDPREPKILGKLKIPGYSDYLHPLDENHIIGFGKDTAEPQEDEFWGEVDFAWYQGMKMAIFDVTDVTNPVEKHKEIIGDRGTDSELLYNHKALMFDAKNGLMAFPVSLAELSEEVKNDPDASGSEYGDLTFQGAYVYEVDAEDGFNLRGRISHYTDDEIAKKSGYYWSGDKDVLRILYIGDYLYTVSNALVQANMKADLEFVGNVGLE